MVAILAIIGAIAIPRVASSAANASEAAMLKDWRSLQSAAELFAAEHSGLGIGLRKSGAAATAAVVVDRLTRTTNGAGVYNANGKFGPYLDKIPSNRENQKNTIRVDGADAGAGTHGWRLDSASSVFAPDTANGIDIVKRLSGSKLDLGGVADLGP